jgi:hypothetical protein
MTTLINVYTARGDMCPVIDAAGAITDSPTVLMAILFFMYHSWLLQKIKRTLERQLTSALDPVKAGSPTQPVPANYTRLSSASFLLQATEVACGDEELSACKTRDYVRESKESTLMDTKRGAWRIDADDSAQENQNPSVEEDHSEEIETFRQQPPIYRSQRIKYPTRKVLENKEQVAAKERNVLRLSLRKKS